MELNKEIERLAISIADRTIEVYDSRPIVWVSLQKPYLITQMNRAMAKILDRSTVSACVFGKPLFSLCLFGEERMEEETCLRLRRLISQSRPRGIELQLFFANGKRGWFEIGSQIEATAAGACIRLTFNDIEARYQETKRLSAELKRVMDQLTILLAESAPFETIVVLRKKIEDLELALSVLELDELSQVYQRSAFMERLENFIVEGVHGVTLLLIDINLFKNINDRHGHPIGDKVIRETGRRIRSNLPLEIGIAGRLGGDEFGVAFLGREDHCLVHAQRIVAALSDYSVPDAHDRRDLIPCTCSVGLARWEDGTSTETLFAHADKAMYLAKARSKIEPGHPQTAIATYPEFQAALAEAKQQMIEHLQPSLFEEFPPRSLPALEFLKAVPA